MGLKKKNRGRKQLLVVLVIILLFVIGLGLSKLTKNVDTISSNEIAVISVKGIISFSGSTIPFQGSGANAQGILDNIEKAKNRNVKAVVFEIDSPGGTVVASKEIANAILNLDKPTVAVIREIGASGAYWVAAATDKIVADELSITGSIGVISSYLEFYEFLNENGVDYNRLVAGKYKDLGSPLKDLTNEERNILQKKLDIVHDSFLNFVKERRALDAKEVERVKTGEFFLGIEAIELGLIDYSGNKEFAISLARNLSNSEGAKITEIKEKKSLFELFSKFGSEVFYHMGRGIGTEISNIEIKEDPRLIV